MKTKISRKKCESNKVNLKELRKRKDGMINFLKS